MEENTIRQTDEIEIDLWEICLVLIHNLALIISVGIMVALGAFLFTQLLVTPTYESTTKIYILNKQENASVTYSDIQLGTQLTKDYAELIQSRFVLEEVVQGMGLDLTYEQMKEKVSVTTPTDTRILAITVKDSDPVMAMKMANAIREAAAVHIMNVMDIQAVNVAETANMPMKKASPSVLKNTLIGGLLGVFLIIAVVLVRYLMDDTVKTPEDVEKYLQLSTLAVIPLNEGESEGKKKKKKVKRS
ncbi:MAG: Wzz/FepE/Etk N-terminal domain-containing protein [Eisenbergiella porci]|uniref:Protein-tyrosine kinase n=1 Tax=Eisenbergiella porci TaxID=2652274 RepID=A0A6N7VV58_9FIRM|nr:MULTISPECIES: Wzz/FepE/Etk N-terminal domain-containing protein [Eisenbergiella]MDY2652968.1 Wzz/FepE/Etk N-terminal domain-containing protein [Eisenbergiella porci]MSS86931.1 protein-tyrosine kinase [Eisenbergiella porci]